MKKVSFKKVMATIAGVVTLSITGLQAQTDSTSIFTSDAGMDVYSSYVWRGAKFGTGAAFQPWVKMQAKGFTLGSWSSVNTGGVEAFESDLYASYNFDFGLGVAVTDYYFGGAYFGDSVHYVEPSITFSKSGFSFLGAYMFNAEDSYVELGYAFPLFTIAVGAGDGAYTTDGEFMVCNVTVKKSKTLQISDKFSLPLTGAVTLNPSSEGIYGYVGISF